VFGDTGWRDVLPEDTDFRGPVDYYGPLAAIYAQAQAVLGCTSPLLPAGLTQRHFDVWAAGGLLLSDATPGLSLFPDELTREISFAHPGRIGGMFQRFEHRPAERADLIRAWRELILAEHTYAHRAATVLDCLGG
jgi:spore maturation protein CgeB